MIKVKRLGYALGCIFLCIGMGTAMGHSQEPASDYVAIPQAVPGGKAPAMQVQLPAVGEQTKEIRSSSVEQSVCLRVVAFAEKYHVQDAAFHGYWWA